MVKITIQPAKLHPSWPYSVIFNRRKKRKLKPAQPVHLWSSSALTVQFEKDRRTEVNV